MKRLRLLFAINLVFFGCTQAMENKDEELGDEGALFINGDVLRPWDSKNNEEKDGWNGSDSLSNLMFNSKQKMHPDQKSKKKSSNICSCLKSVCSYCGLKKRKKKEKKSEDGPLFDLLSGELLVPWKWNFVNDEFSKINSSTQKAEFRLCSYLKSAKNSVCSCCGLRKRKKEPEEKLLLRQKSKRMREESSEGVHTTDPIGKNTPTFFNPVACLKEFGKAVCRCCFKKGNGLSSSDESFYDDWDNGEDLFEEKNGE